MKNILRFLYFIMCVILMISFSPETVFADEAEMKEIPDIYIKAINPGYVVDGENNVGEMIEIGRKKSDTRVSLASLTVGYTNSSGNKTVLFEFPENSFMVGESILLRLASSPESELAAERYIKTLAFKGEISLEFNSKILDSVCWTGKKGCLKEFKSSAPTSLLRDLETGIFEHVSDYYPEYSEKDYYVEPVMEEVQVAKCRGLEFSEILSYYDSSKTEQFVEIYNAGSEQILMDGCKIEYKNKFYDLSGILGSDKYYVYIPIEFSLTKNPANKGTLKLIDANGDVVDILEYPNGQKKGASYAMIGFDGVGEEIWRSTYAPTPGEANNYQEYKTCEDGKVINRATGNCVKTVNLTEKICPEGQYLNILTGRCKKYETSVTVKKCKDGYELNLETNRCRKIKNNTGADYSLEPEKFEEKTSFIALYAVIGVVFLGSIYLIFEFRKEILKIFDKVFRRDRGKPHL